MRPWFPGFPTRAACPWGALAPTCRARVAARTPWVPQGGNLPARSAFPGHLWPAEGAHARWTAEKSTAYRRRSLVWRVPRETPDQTSLDEGTGYADTFHGPRCIRRPEAYAPPLYPLASLAPTAAPEPGTESAVEWGAPGALSRGGHYTAFRTTAHSLAWPPSRRTVGRVVKGNMYSSGGRVRVSWLFLVERES